MNITFNELRTMKDNLPDGTMHKIADELDISVESVRNYFGGANYQQGAVADIHIEKGPSGGIVHLENTVIYEMAQKYLAKEE